MKTYKFPYILHAGLWLPLIPITLPKEIDVYALLDSGANISLFQAQLGEEIGIKVNEGKEIFLTGIGGRILAYEHKVPIKVVDTEFVCKIAFSYELKVSVNLLGEENFFEHFIVIFDRSKKIVELRKK